jgi:hypothetical protein
MKKVTTISGFVVAFFGGFDAKNATIAMLFFFVVVLLRKRQWQFVAIAFF